jgi:hypothetical protein
MKKDNWLALAGGEIVQTHTVHVGEFAIDDLAHSMFLSVKSYEGSLLCGESWREEVDDLGFGSRHLGLALEI